MELKYIDNLDKIKDDSVLIARKAIAIRIEKNIDNADVMTNLVTRFEVLTLEAERRGLVLENT